MTALIEHGSTIGDHNHAEWLERRRQSIGASECAAVLGVSPYPNATRLNVYLRKLGRMPEIVENAAMRRGKRQEGMILDEYRELTGQAVADQVFLVHPILPHMTATLDGVRDDGAIVEIKCVGYRSAHQWGEEGTDEIPWHYLCQVHHQLAVSGAPRAEVAALIGGSDLRIYQVARDDQVIARIEELLTEFWAHVVNEVPPEITGIDLPLMRHLYPDTVGMIELGDEQLELVRVFEQLGGAIKEQEAERAAVKTQILDAMGNASLASLPDGRQLTRKLVEVGESQITRKAYSFIDFRIKKGRAQ